MKVLLADDDLLFRTLLQKSVSGWGHEAIVVSDGEQAWQELRNDGGPSLAILDWTMPGADGLEVCRRVRQAGLPHYVYIILLTARTESADLVAGLEAGADEYLGKPVDLRNLKLRVESGCRILDAGARQETGRQHTELLLGQLRRLSGKLFRMQDEERRAVALELHESIAQVLSGVMMNLGCVRTAELSGKSAEMLSEAISMTGDCVRDLRAVSFRLHPLLLDEIGLVPALRSYADGMGQHTGLDIRLNVPAGFGRLDRTLEMTCFRIAQEAIENVRRHSGSPRAVIRLARNSTDVRLEVEDEGCGFPVTVCDSPQPMPAAGGVGILGMRERVEQYGGRLEIQSTSKGATVIATLPCVPLT